MAVLLILPELMEMFYMSGCRGMFEVCDRTTLYELDRGRNKKRSWDRRHGFCRTENRFSGIRFKEEEAMAFVQVVRRSMRPEEYTDLRAGWLKRFLYESKYEITDIEITDARQTGENTYEYYPGGYRRLKKGDIYFTPDGTVFLRQK